MAAIGTETTRRLDALVVGAGFGGIYMLHKLRNDLGLDAVAIDKAGGVGGTWYWNKYPGALSDSEGFVYQYSFDRDLYAQTPWKTKFVRQPEILEYLNGVVDRYDLRDHIALQTAMTDASFDEVAGIWTVHTDRGVTFESRFLVIAVQIALPIQPCVRSDPRAGTPEGAAFAVRGLGVCSARDGRSRLQRGS
jgi:cyclohexanone monooxygenase